MPEEKIIFYSGKNKRVGILNRANKNKSCVIFAHGFLGNKDYFKKGAEIFSFHDIATFRFDFVGHGESEGSSLDITISQEVEDMKRAIEVVKTEGYEKIGLFGISLGGTIAILSFNEKINCITVINPLIFPKEVFLKFFDHEKLREMERKGYVNYLTKDNRRIPISEKFFEEIINIDVISAIKKINCPILFIVSSKDAIVNPKQSEKAHQEANKPKKLEVISDADHSLSNPEHKNYAFEISALWFKKWLK
ncbi:MAG: alpha/beta fold hydrolase [Candidatus Aenigmatarchaeota archaeon]